MGGKDSRQEQTLPQGDTNLAATEEAHALLRTACLAVYELGIKWCGLGHKTRRM